MKQSRTLFLICILILSLNGTGQKINVQELNSTHGLSTDKVNHIIQDRDGFIWIFTDLGIARYDGYDLLQFNELNYNNQSALHVTSVCVDRNGKLWLGINDEAALVFNTKNGDLQKRYAPNNSDIRKVFSDSKGDIWLNSDRGIYKYDVLQQKYTEIPVPGISETKPKRIRVQSFHEDADSNIWISIYKKGVYVKLKDSNSFIKKTVHRNPNDRDMSKNTNYMFVDSKKRLWISIEYKGVFVTNTLTSDTLYINKIPATGINRLWCKNVNRLIEDKNGMVWATSSLGVRIIDPTSMTILPVNHELYALDEKANHPYKSVYIDNQDQVWLSSETKGVIRYNFKELKFNHILLSHRGEVFSDQNVQCLYPLNDHQLFIAGKTMFLELYDFSNQTFTSLKRLIPSDLANSSRQMISCIYRDIDSNIWVGFQNDGLLVIKPDFSFNLYNNLTKPRVTRAKVSCITQDKYKRIWLGKKDGIFIIQKNNSQITITKPKDYCTKPYNQLLNLINDFEKFNNEIWIATANSGVFRVTFTDTTSFNIKHFDLTKTGLGNSVNTIFVDSYNQLWIGTHLNGLCKYNDSLQAFTSVLEDNENLLSVFSIEEDNQGKLWLGTNKGLFSYNLRSSLPKVVQYTTKEGIQSNVYSKNASCKMSNGLMVFGGQNGLNAFYPKNIAIDTTLTPQTVTDILVNNQRMAPSNAMNLHHTENNIQFKFATINYSLQDKCNYKYRLVGYNDEWTFTNSKNRTAVYTNLKPGEYVFEFCSSNPSGIWNKTTVQTKFKIRRSPWKTYWAYAIYVSIILFVIYGRFYSIIKQLKLKQALNIEKLEREKADKVNTFKLQFYANISHELLTPLSIIENAFLQIVDNKKNFGTRKNIIIRNIRRLNNLITQLLEFRKVETDNLTLKTSYENLSEKLRQIQDSFSSLAQEKNIEFTLDCPDEMYATVDIDILDKVLFNLLSNAFKYTGQNGEVCLKSEKLNHNHIEHISITVSDSGIGIPPDKLDHIFKMFFRADKDSATGLGIGLTYTKSLIDFINGEIWVESEEGVGTKFKVLIPNQISTNTKEEQMPELALHESRKSIKTPVDGVIIKKHISVLLLEDNEDLRSIIVDDLEKYFTVYIAENGKSGLKKMELVNPDIIISDVMMPVMNGFEFCEKVKSDISTAHIPIILLTAKNTDENKQQGYLHGADAYFTKPFNMEVLITRVFTLYQKKKLLQEYFTNHEFIQNPTPQTIDSQDEKYMHRILGLLEKNYNNPEFTVKSLEKELSTSKSMLYRKVKHYTGLSPSDYIRHYRLNCAKQMLASKKYTVTEVAFNCGFSSLSHFGSCFKKQFDVSPSDLLEC
ncbi:MAG: ATP-binding protein [Bacteroidales bacterium]|nr:ATP-binding protein [Bacteroidales bacterium]